MKSRHLPPYLATAVALAAGAASTPLLAVQEEITVSATRVERDILTVPLAVTTVERDDIQRRQLLGLDESLGRIPGLYASGRYNFSRDLRISMRGFGARGNFGIRGLKVFVDGIPSTAPDGQTALDDLDLNSVERVEVTRGLASALYGQSAGGVINITTESGTPKPFAEAGMMFGEDDYTRSMFKTGGEAGALNYYVNGSYLDYDGYRDHADFEQGTINSKFRYAFADGSVGQLIFRAADAPNGDDAGGLTLAEATADRRQARDRNVAFDASEKVKEQKLGVSWNKRFDVHELSLRNYYNWREFDANLPLPPFLGDGAVQFDRFFYGGGGQYSNSTPLFGHGNRATLGFEVETITDDRQRFQNLNGSRGALGFDQDEVADTVGVFLQNEFAITEQIGLQAGLRYDHIVYEVEDKFFANGDQSSRIEFNELNPMFGINYSLRPELNLYANYATSFETPTFTELASPAESGTLGGFANVAPQRAEGYEVGVKGVVAGRVRYELAFYDMDVEDEVTNVADRNGRAFFENADTERHGVEAGLVAELLEGLDFTATYTYTNFDFDRFPTAVGAEGKRLPGVPRHFGYLEFDYTHPTGLWAKWDLALAGSLYADNLNQTQIGAYQVSNLMFGYDWKRGPLTVSPNVGITNLFDELYNADVRIQDQTLRYYEPAPDRSAFGGLRLRYEFDT